jgi:hypothetical protein
MRKSLVLATLVVLVCSAVSFAGVPDPSRSGCALNAQPLACQWRFRADGGFDRLTLRVTVRDAFDAPVANCSTYCNLGGASLVAAQCNGNRKGGLTNAGGVVNFVYRCIGGRGSVQLRVTAVCSGNVGLCSPTINFTNPDQNASNEGPMLPGSTTVVDLGLWAAGLPPSPYLVTSDFNCDGLVSVIDLGLWASGLSKGCVACP